MIFLRYLFPRYLLFIIILKKVFITIIILLIFIHVWRDFCILILIILQKVLCFSCLLLEFFLHSKFLIIIQLILVLIHKILEKVIVVLELICDLWRFDQFTWYLTFLKHFEFFILTIIVVTLFKEILLFWMSWFHFWLPLRYFQFFLESCYA